VGVESTPAAACRGAGSWGLTAGIDRSFDISVYPELLGRRLPGA
jgi:hypothetical protein